MNFKNLFKADYWFSQPHTAYDWAFWPVVLVFGGLILSGIVLYVIRSSKTEKTDQVVFGRFGNFGITMGLIGLLWLFFRQERVAFLAWRFWLLLWLLLAAWWIGKILEYIVKRLPIIKKERLEKERIRKYLPTK